VSALTDFITATRTTMMGDAYTRKARARVHHRLNARTTPDQVREILDLRDRRGWSVARIASKMKLPTSTVQSVINGNGARTILPIG